MLKVIEQFVSIQGEGGKSGTAMQFIRLAGCNLSCPYCDTNYARSGGVLMSEEEILEKCNDTVSWICLTGGEPLIQDVRRLVYLLHERGYLVALETNGTQPIPEIFDHVVVSPKRDTDLNITARMLADEWKYIIQDDSDFERIEYEANVFLQPVDNNMDIARKCVEEMEENPGWRLSLQLHKLIGIR